MKGFGRYGIIVKSRKSNIAFWFVVGGGVGSYFHILLIVLDFAPKKHWLNMLWRSFGLFLTPNVYILTAFEFCWSSWFDLHTISIIQTIFDLMKFSHELFGYCDHFAIAEARKKEVAVLFILHQMLQSDIIVFLEYFLCLMRLIHEAHLSKYQDNQVCQFVALFY